jgi:hypothetical protein
LLAKTWLRYYALREAEKSRCGAGQKCGQEENMEGKHLSLEVRVHGKPVREYQHQGKFYIEGRKGSEFTLRVRNRSERRILVVPSVDGLSVMDGKEASFDSSGYILDAYDFIDIPGWRLNLDEIAKFFFSAPGESYAAKKDKPQNIGVIGCAVFMEKVAPAWRILRSYHMGSPDPGGTYRGAAFDNCSSSELNVSHIGSNTVCSVQNAQEGPQSVYCNQVQPSLGTGFGEKASHKVHEVAFERASETPDELVELHYDSREGLQRRGVDVRKKPVIGTPNPFPGEKFCQPPKDWR